MGIPALFRWLSTKYPKVTSQVIEDEITTNILQPNPNNTEFDNLYLDMNGIIHPCCHPEDKQAPATEHDMMIEIFAYIDRIVNIIRPRKLLYMAIDGVAPRAKMNQQRSRRFRAAQEEDIKRKDEERIKNEFIKSGQELPLAEPKVHFDSNCITPGTPFMDNLASCLRYYIANKLNNDPGWKDVVVLLSDANVPGEGEHKIMDYIRRQRNMPDYNPNTHHVLYGLDADLIMLALATHEPHFKILREDVFFQDGKDKGCFICGQKGHMAVNCTGKKKETLGNFDEKTKASPQKPYIFLHVPILREYLEAELKMLDIPFRWSLERAIDDWVFLCFFVGNDFLPHLPSLEIREGAIDTLVELWKTNLKNWGDYLTHSGTINLKAVEDLMNSLGNQEDKVFQKRRDIEEKKRLMRIQRKREARERNLGYKSNYDRNNQNDVPRIVQSAIRSDIYAQNPKAPSGNSLQDNKAAAAALKAALVSSITATDDALKRKHDDIESPVAVAVEVSVSEDFEEIIEESEVIAPILDDEDELIPAKDEDGESEPDDNIKLWESGWKERYYEKKFDVDLSNTKFRKSVVESYVEGLCWVLKYYYQGVQSWKWYYPYHYSPFASDFSSVSNLKIVFELGTPFKPVEQLMGVLPALSNSHIPAPLRVLMEDPDSPIFDFYPEKFPIDLNGKKYAWQGVALLPFIDESRLLKAMEPYYDLLTKDEKRRNSLGNEIIVVSSANAIYTHLCSTYGKPTAQEKVLPLSSKHDSFIFGTIAPYSQACLPGKIFESPLKEKGEPDIEQNTSISVIYFMPDYPPGYIFKAILLRNVSFDNPVLDDYDKQDVRNNYHGRNSYGRRKQNQQNQYTSREVAGRFLKHGIAPTPESSGYDTRNVREGSDYYSQDSIHGKRTRYENSSYQSASDRGGNGNSYQSHSGGYISNANNYGNRDNYYQQPKNSGYASQYSNQQQYSSNSQTSSFLSSLVQSSAVSTNSDNGYSQQNNRYSNQATYNAPNSYSNQQQYGNNQSFVNQSQYSNQGSFSNQSEFVNQSQYSNQRYTQNQSNTTGNSSYRSNPQQGQPQNKPANLAWNRNVGNNKR